MNKKVIWLSISAAVLAILLVVLRTKNNEGAEVKLTKVTPQETQNDPAKIDAAPKKK